MKAEIFSPPDQA